MSNSSTPGVSRRTLARGAAWAAPAVIVTAAAPRAAASLVKDPGINGWVLNTTRSTGTCRYTLEVDSTIADRGPDGAPFGLYAYDVDDRSTFTNARLVYWIIGDQSATWANLAGHSGCWSGPTRGTPATKADGLVYTPYTWTYTCPILAANRRVDSDGVERLYLGNFHVRASFTQPSAQCDNVTYWTQRFITVDPDGPGGSQQPEVQTFERRNGSLGPYTARARMASPAQATGGGVPAQALAT